MAGLMTSREGGPRVPYERIRRAAARSVGTKQTLKAVEKGEAKAVFVARDAEERVIGPLVRLCQERGVEIVWVDEMAALGKACGVEVKTASAAVLAE